MKVVFPLQWHLKKYSSFTNFIFWENNKLWRPFSHRKSCFSKKLWTKKSCELKLNFIEKNPFVISTFQSKVMVRNQSQCLKELFFDIFIHCLWFLFITFDFKVEITNGFLLMKVNFISQLFLVQSFLKKHDFL